MLRYMLDSFWSEAVWLPPNTTWKDIAPGPDKNIVYTDYRHLLFPLLFALVLIGLRTLLEKWVNLLLRFTSILKCFSLVPLTLRLLISVPTDAWLIHLLSILRKYSQVLYNIIQSLFLRNKTYFMYIVIKKWYLPYKVGTYLTVLLSKFR